MRATPHKKSAHGRSQPVPGYTMERTLKFLPLMASAIAVLATPASARSIDDRIREFPAEGWALIALNASDFGTTSYCLRRGLCHEANPTLAWAVGSNPSDAKLTAAFAITSLLDFAMITLIQDHSPRMARSMAITGTVLKGGVTAANLRFAF